MIDSTPNLLSFPNADGDHPDQRPLPEIIADGNPDEPNNPGWPSFSLAYHDVEGNRYYAVQDWIAGVARPVDPRIFWSSMKRRFRKAKIELYSWCIQLPYAASNGKKYKMEFATAEGLYIITQRMDAETGLRDRVLRFLAQAGVLVDESRVDPDGLLARVVGTNPERAIELAIDAYREMGRSDEWIASRLTTVQTRKWFTAVFQKSLRIAPVPSHFGKITDTMRLGVWKRKTSTLKKQMNLGKKDSLRDNMSALALNYELLAENAAAYVLAQQQNLAFDEADMIVREKSELVGRQAEEMGRSLNIDIATNKPLITD